MSRSRPFASASSRRSVDLGRTLAGLALSAALALGPCLTPSVVQAQEGGGINLIRDTEIEETLHADSDPIFRAAGLVPKDVTLMLVGDKDLNAFTVNGQAIFVNTGLIVETANPNQLEGVIAHETGHAAGGHSVRSGDMEKAAMAPFLMTLGLGVLAAAAGAPDAAIALIGSSQYFGVINMLTFSRAQEAAADQAAITYMQRSGKSARGLVDFFENFRYEEVFSEARRFKFFQSHPVSGERIELLRRRAEEQSHYNDVDTAEDQARHDVMKAKLFAFMNPPQQTFIKYTEKDTSYPARYARAIAYYKALETDHAIRDIDALIADYPTNPYLYELKGQVWFEVGKSALAEKAHARSVELKPGAPLLRINLAQAIIAQGDEKRTDEAIAHLQKALSVEGDNAFAWRLMSQAYDAKGEAGAARLAAAEERFAVGDMTQARIFALRARQLLTRDTPQWRRATDIVLVSNPSKDDLRMMAGQTGLANLPH
jgi:predicted Zn-dependent protease